MVWFMIVRIKPVTCISVSTMTASCVLLRQCYAHHIGDPDSLHATSKYISSSSAVFFKQQAFIATYYAVAAGCGVVLPPKCGCRWRSSNSFHVSWIHVASSSELADRSGELSDVLRTQKMQVSTCGGQVHVSNASVTTGASMCSIFAPFTALVGRVEAFVGMFATRVCQSQYFHQWPRRHREELQRTSRKSMSAT